MEEKHKVTIITGQLVVGGAEKQLYLWLKHMDRTLFDPVVLTLHPGHGDYWEKPIEDLEIPLLRIPHDSNPIKRAWSIIQQLRCFKPDLIHGWHLFSGAYAGLVGQFLHVPTIGGLRSSLIVSEKNPEVIISRLLCKGIIANSTEAVRSWMSLAPRRQKVFNIPNALSQDSLPRVEVRSYLAKKYRIDSDHIWIGSIGRLDPLKRFDLLLSMLGRLNPSSIPVHLVLIGDGPELPNLRNQAISLGLDDQVSFTGEIPVASRFLSAFDLFCFPSISEGLPNVIIEAAAVGLPIVAWDLLFNREILDSESAMLLPAEDLDSFTDAVSQLIVFPDLRQELGKRAQERVLNEFDLDYYVKRMTSAYLDVLGKGEFGADNL